MLPVGRAWLSRLLQKELKSAAESRAGTTRVLQERLRQPRQAWSRMSRLQGGGGNSNSNSSSSRRVAAAASVSEQEEDLDDREEGGGGGGDGENRVGGGRRSGGLSGAPSCNFTEDSFTKPHEFAPRRALILSKVSRYEFEMMRHREDCFGDDAVLREILDSRGSDYYLMRKHHEIHLDNERRLVSALEERGVETRLCKRFDYTDASIKWADIVFTAGGDGTYLMAASKILDDQKPVVGINTDCTRSEGHLCLPRHYSENIEDAVEQILSGAFYWFLRKRLRITLIGDKDQVLEPAIELHTQQLQYPEYRFFELVSESDPTGDHPLIENFLNGSNGDRPLSKRVLPILALNEVFVGESLSSRVSYLEVKLDRAEPVKTRNSGLCISTGTGSTSWTFNINKLTQQSVEKLLRIVYETTHFPINFKDSRLVEAVTQKFNNEIVFDPERNMMAYTLRDPVSVGIFPGAAEKRPRGKANRIEVKSRCFDACLVIDGSLSFKFNDGMRAVIEIKDEDALRTMQLYSGVH